MDFDSFAVICGHAGTPAAMAAGGLIGGLFLAGLTGSVAHCGPMCGPLVVAQAASRLSDVPAARICELTRVRNGLLLPYHLGRLTTYGALGAMVALIGHTLLGLSWFHYVSAALLVTAAGLFFWQAFALSPSSSLSGFATLWSRLPARAAGRFNRPSVVDGYRLGLLLGFIPCGLVYAALAACAASAHPLMGAIGMMAFGLGTVPMLAGIGMMGQVAMVRMRRFASFARPILMTLNGGMLLFLAASWVS